MSKKKTKSKEIVSSKPPTQKEFRDGINSIWKKMRSGMHVAQVDENERDKVMKKLFFRIYMPSVNEEYRTGSYMDKYPQILTIEVSQAETDEFVEIEVPLAINRLSVNEGKAWVIEITRIQSMYDYGVFDASDTPQQIISQLSTKELGAISFPDSTTFFINRVSGMDAGSGGSLGHEFMGPQNFDMTSEGKGFLIGSDSIFAAIDSENLPGATTMVLKVFYRFTEVGLAEYVGIVQGEED